MAFILATSMLQPYNYIMKNGYGEFWDSSCEKSWVLESKKES